MTDSKFIHEQVAPKERYDVRSFRTKVIDGHRIITGCPVGKYLPRSKRCKVAIEAQAILHPKDPRHKKNPVCNLKVMLAQSASWIGGPVDRVIKVNIPTIKGYVLHVGQLHKFKYVLPNGRGKFHDFKNTHIFTQAKANWMIIQGNFKFDSDRGFINK